MENIDASHLMVFFIFYLDLDASTPKRSEVLTILKIQKLLEEEITKRRIVEKQLKRTQSKLTNANCGTEDSIR